ncbi:MAG: HlyD family efflux transporter periplasmic adaptor subunit [Rhodocyclaceae bacterium]|nr:HlyD family efflux transporter periplasmic adaptor subunit [Rhodocyclaceae bacterium]
MTRTSPTTALLVLLIAACSRPESGSLQGYAEGEYVRVAAPYAGRLEKLDAQRGTTVTKNAPLFVLEQENEAAGRREAEERLKTAQARHANLLTGRRAPELDAIGAEEDQARVAQKLSEAQLQRQEKLFAAGFIGREMLDQARTAAERDRQRVRQASAQLQTARLPARPEEIHAAERDVAAAKAALAQADWRLGQKTVASPVAGLVQDTLYVAGEWVPAGSPVVSLLPPQNIKLRFFLPEDKLGSVKTGQEVSVSCDGCGAPISARISFIATGPEYTPPVIYSKESRAKLVYLVEARPAPNDAPRLHPGQPVDVVLK